MFHSCATAPDKELACKRAPPVTNCEITLTADELKAETIVDLEVEFKFMSSLEINGTIEFAFPGFKADFENKTNINVETEVTRLGADPSLSPVTWSLLPYAPMPVEPPPDVGRRAGARASFAEILASLPYHKSLHSETSPGDRRDASVPGCLKYYTETAQGCVPPRAVHRRHLPAHMYYMHACMRLLCVCMHKYIMCFGSCMHMLLAYVTEIHIMLVCMHTHT
jgi:hypothetical protein